MCVVKTFPFHVRIINPQKKIFSRNGRGGKVGGDVQMKENEKDQELMFM
jgi:hypothetical protein